MLVQQVLLLTEPSPLNLITEACLVYVVHQEKLWPPAIFVVLPGCSVGLSGLETHLCSAHLGSAQLGSACPGSAYLGLITRALLTQALSPRGSPVFVLLCVPTASSPGMFCNWLPQVSHLPPDLPNPPLEPVLCASSR